MGDIKIYLDAVRVNTGMNQEEWAKELGVSKATVCTWETGRSAPSFENVQKMAELSGIPIQYIFVRNNPNK